MGVSIIVAAAANNVIGRHGALPWHLPEDLRRFRALTMGKPLVMGRLTHEAIGRPLPGRRNIVISRQPGYRAEGCEVVASPAAALDAAAGADEIMVIGGGRVYRQLLPLTDRIYLTRVHARPEGDAFFPALNDAEWRILAPQEFTARGDERLHGFTVKVLQRIGT